MDRLFLQALTTELRSSIVGRRVRSAAVDRERGLLSLALGPRSALNFSYVPDVAGPFLGVFRRGGTMTPGLKTKVVSASIRGLECAELDRIVTLSLDQTKLSGKRAASELVLEVFSNRVALYLVDGDSNTIVETFATSRSRQSSGERYEAPPPPPTAGPLAADAAAFEHRLSAGLARGLSRRAALLAASGWTPLVARELEWLVDEDGRNTAEAFELVRARLEAKEPVLYAASSDGGKSQRPCLLSPMKLGSEKSLESRVHGTFSEALSDGVDRRARFQSLRAVRSKLESALTQKVSKAKKLRSRLHDDLGSLEEPSELRLRGETLLAGLSRARRSPDGSVVVVPDSFDPDEREIEIRVDPRLPLSANAERFFSRARKAQRSAEELRRRIDALDGNLSYWETLECDLRDADELEDLEALEEEAREEGLIPAATPRSRMKVKTREAPRERRKPRRYLSRRGSVILVGRSGRSNDETTFRIARPDDLWFHAAGIPGAHVVLRVPPGTLPDDEELEDAASFAAYFSKGREDTRVDVIVTERRHVSKIKGGPPGLVRVQNVRTLRVVPRRPEEREEEDS